jgi:preprotein translocase subunit SecF
VEAKVMKTCEVCGRRIRTGRKYCYEHRGTRSDNIVDKTTTKYIQYHMNKTFASICMLFILLLIPFLLVGFFINQFFTITWIGIVVSAILSLYISIKYLKVKFMPQLDVQNKKPDYVNWVQKKVNKVKDDREFKKNLWK